MFKNFFVILSILISTSALSNETSLTVQQQLERLQRELSDLSKVVFSNTNSTENQNNNNLSLNLSAIDMRIYDLEKDVKNLTANLEEIFFQIDDLTSSMNNLEETIDLLNNSLSQIKNNNSNSNSNQISLDEENNTIIENNINSENTLGSLKISPEPDNDDNNLSEKEIDKPNLSPEDQFQIAFDNVRKKNWENARNSFKNFIIDYPDNQLSGSAHYWLGELYILDQKYRDAAMVFAEGYQKFPKSIKAPDMLFKLSQSLIKVDKKDDACKTLELLMIEFPKNKFVKKVNENINENDCLKISQ